jgi:pyruvyltransferase
MTNPESSYEPPELELDLDQFPPPTAYWWKGHPNFGDMLTFLLMERFADTTVEWAPAQEANIFAVGSILEAIPSGWRGIVAGSGRLFEQSTLHLEDAIILGLRGPLSAKGVKGDYAIGDPGLLADELVTVDKEYNLGLVPHWSDTVLETQFGQYNPRIIRPEGDPLEVIREIGRCRKIVSSSLHGLIVADAFGIPRRIELVGAKFIKEGGDFKFRDYHASIGMPFTVGVLQEAPRYNVQDRQSELYDMLASLGRILMGAAR